jgi:HAD superfamily hydrolase (TIGR01509 family)
MDKPRLKVKTVFFDLDGTIVDSKEAYLTAMKTALLRTGRKSEVNLKLATEIPRRLEQNLPINDLIQGADEKEFLKHYLHAYYQATATKSKPMPSISNTLERLSRRVKIGLITMRYVPKEKLNEELSRFNLAKYFQCIVTAYDTRSPKPSPEALIKCAEQLNTEIVNCAVVGDSVADIRAGKNAGTKTVAVLSGIFSRQELKKEKPDLILKSAKDLPDYLE